MLYFTIKELNPRDYPVSDEQLANLTELIRRVSIVREAYGSLMKVTSGLRSEADQMRINPKAPKSNHLTGSAVDISDKDGALKEWIKSHIAILETADLYIEHWDSTPTWLHLQIKKPGSGRRVFKP